MSADNVTGNVTNEDGDEIETSIMIVLGVGTLSSFLAMALLVYRCRVTKYEHKWRKEIIKQQKTGDVSNIIVKRRTRFNTRTLKPDLTPRSVSETGDMPRSDEFFRGSFKMSQVFKNPSTFSKHLSSRFSLWFDKKYKTESQTGEPANWDGIPISPMQNWSNSNSGSTTLTGTVLGLSKPADRFRLSGDALNDSPYSTPPPPSPFTPSSSKNLRNVT
eukprot:CAMPEP_0204828882 /NCGR_PEP_ID=MMETSP1346-20131115/6839_1 /ASSEMBLY_ACC=CAM_ASM_000771 /TAXON_ID=215587 /ORGANISM="Aplanochytrium stocchinoi, Strain GSBS06" /LENGTH=216 /DNA_ID=CAMNT_0051958263 /DNA_START=364 /DNA_END=1014 /DNA_ORIENTATION=+